METVVTSEGLLIMFSNKISLVIFNS